jgi:hypothetical protein
MSSPSFLLANETNHVLLRSLLEAINAIVEHQYSSELCPVLCVVVYVDVDSEQKTPSSFMRSSRIKRDSKHCAL